LQAEIVTIGTELLLGEIVDTNSAWIAQELTKIGLNLYYTVTVGDNLGRVAEVLRTSLRRSDVVITTGGLGPTVDDITREAVAEATGQPLILDEALLEEIACYFARRNHPMTENNRKQAERPAGAQVIHNPVGTAPAFCVEAHGHLVICLPGVPHEMKHLMTTEVIPLLRERFGLRGVIRSRTLRTSGIGESAIGARIDDLMRLANPTVGTAAHPGQTDVRITAKGESEAEALALIAPVEAELRLRLGDFIFGVDQESIGDVVSHLLAERGRRLALVETVTQGQLAHDLARAVDGRGALAGSVILPDADALSTALGVPADVSQEAAERAAEAVRRAYGADLGLAILGPRDPGAPDAPPVFMSLSVGGRARNGVPRPGRSGVSGQGWLIHLALDLVRRELLGLPAPE
jgi:nicotinamide-nucleotide amidase